MTIVRMIRHGEAEYRSSGEGEDGAHKEDNGLSEVGRGQAEKVGLAINKIVSNPVEIISLDARRTIETGTIIQELLDAQHHSRELKVSSKMPELENGFGAIEAKGIWSSREPKSPLDLKNGANINADIEDVLDYIARQTLEVVSRSMQEDEEQDIIVCTYGLAIRSVVRLMRKAKDTSMLDYYLPYASVTRIDINNNDDDATVKYIGARSDVAVGKEFQIRYRDNEYYPRPAEPRKYF